MSISIVILKYGNELVLHLGNWESKKEARDLTDENKDGGVVLLLEEYREGGRNTHSGVLEALANCAYYDDSMGSEIEKLLRFVFRLGIKAGRTLPGCMVQNGTCDPTDAEIMGMTETEFAEFRHFLPHRTHLPLLEERLKSRKEIRRGNLGDHDCPRPWKVCRSSDGKLYWQ